MEIVRLGQGVDETGQLAPEALARTMTVLRDYADDAALDTVTAAVPVREARTLVGLAGSVTTVAAIVMGLPAYDAARIHHAARPRPMCAS